MSFSFYWCRHRELNTGFILTMDAYYHYTMSAYKLLYYNHFKKFIYNFVYFMAYK